MTNIAERFAALPRARKGTTAVVIVEESVLAELIGDAQASEGDLVRRSIGRARREDTQANEHLTPKPLHEQVPGAWNFVEPPPGPAAGGSQIVIHVDEPGLTTRRVVEALEEVGRPRRRGRGRSW